jgi:hypothetical protein
METWWGTITFIDGKEKEQEVSLPIVPVDDNKKHPLEGQWYGERDGEHKGRYQTVVMSFDYFSAITWPDSEHPDIDLVKGKCIITNNTITMVTIENLKEDGWAIFGEKEIEDLGIANKGTYTLSSDGNTFTLYGGMSDNSVGGQLFHRQIFD